MNNTSDTVRAALRQHNMTQADAAKRLGISAQYMSDIVRGRRRISVSVAVRMERVLKLDAGKLLHAQSGELIKEARKRRG